MPSGCCWRVAKLMSIGEIGWVGHCSHRPRVPLILTLQSCCDYMALANILHCPLRLGPVYNICCKSTCEIDQKQKDCYWLTELSTKGREGFPTQKSSTRC